LDNLTILLVSVVLSFLLGAVAATISARGSRRSELEKACENLRKEFEAEKRNVGDQLGQELSRMRDSLLKTLEAYEGAAKVVEEKFKREMPHTALEGALKPAELDFFQNSVRDEHTAPSFLDAKINQTSEADNSPMEVCKHSDRDKNSHFADDENKPEDVSKSANISSLEPFESRTFGHHTKGKTLSEDEALSDEEELNKKYH
jgi:hypothetical protein